jgi:hypothetical protein
MTSYGEEDYRCSRGGRKAERGARGRTPQRQNAGTIGKIVNKGVSVSQTEVCYSTFLAHHSHLYNIYKERVSCLNSAGHRA